MSAIDTTDDGYDAGWSEYYERWAHERIATYGMCYECGGPRGNLTAHRGDTLIVSIVCLDVDCPRYAQADL